MTFTPDARQLFPPAGYLYRAFCGETVPAAWREISETAAAMIPAHHLRRDSMRRFLTAESCGHCELAAAVRAFVGAEIELAALVTTIDHLVAGMLKGRAITEKVWHTETVGLVVSRLAGLWLDDLTGDRGDGSGRLDRIGRAYDCLIDDLTSGRRSPPDMF